MNIGLRTSPYKNEVSILWISSQVLQPITGSDFKRVLDDQKYNDLMRNYSLANVFSHYGKPDQIISRMEIIVENDVPAFLDMRILYLEKGIYINYRMYPQFNQNQVITCPFQSFISLWLISPFTDTSYQELLSSVSSDWNGFFLSDNNTLLKLDQIGYMSIDSFYNQFMKPTNSCLVTPRSIWPRP
jgi:hypothetical protein